MTGPDVEEGPMPASDEYTVSPPPNTRPSQVAITAQLVDDTEQEQMRRDFE